MLKKCLGLQAKSQLYCLQIIKVLLVIVRDNLAKVRYFIFIVSMLNMNAISYKVALNYREDCLGTL